MARVLGFSGLLTVAWLVAALPVAAEDADEEQKTEGTLRVWMDPFVPLRVPLIFNLRRDPYERAEITSNTYYDWMIDRAFMLYGAQAIVGNFLQTFKEFPPRQKAASFTVDQAMKKLQPQAH
jgi:arylsulfatase